VTDDDAIPDDDDRRQLGYVLAMPFVVVVSVGGPFEDHAYAAGWSCGKIDQALAHRPARYETAVDERTMPQLDLVAMAHGYRMTPTTPLPHMLDNVPHPAGDVRFVYVAFVPGDTTIPT
jgi:hypothetical protein